MIGIKNNDIQSDNPQSGRGFFPPIKLSWKLVLFTVILILFVTAAITYPIYWQTRQALENQLTNHLEQNIQLVREQIDTSLVNLLADYPELNSVRDSLETKLNWQAGKFSAQAIYLIDASGRLLVIAGNEESALQSATLHAVEIASARNDQVTSSPLFADRTGQYYKSVFTKITGNNSQSVVLGLDAGADFLEITGKLRNQILSLTAIILIISIGLVLLLARTMTKPLENLTKYAEAIGQGRSDLPVLNHRRDEIGFLSRTIQTMYGKISQREKENKQFLASVAHEIRNPLGGMKINAELLLEDTDNLTNATKYATAIAREVDRLALIVDSFLAYARPIETNLIICDLNELLQQVISELQRDFPSAKITVSGQARVKVNPGKIRLCLLNLIRNGLEAVPEAPAIKINITNKPGQTEIRFFNAGMPIAPEIQSQIFEAFFSTKPDGIGLGLAITKSLVEQHGGQIYLDHSNTSGTEFVLILPE